MTLDQIAIIALIALAVLVLIAAALLIWTSALLLRVERLSRRIEGSRARDWNGRPLRERV